MQRFNWRDVIDRPLAERFPFRIGESRLNGLEAWIELAGILAEFARAAPVDAWQQEELCARRFDDFLEGADIGTRHPRCCVFVSHRSTDTALAERVAWLVNECGFDYWLDVHDPVLARVNRMLLPSPLAEVLVAAAVEIAVLNCSHVIALHTDTSHLSKWIPYEFGRAKARRIATTQACSWFHPGVPAPMAGEYTWLGARTRSEADIEGWLKREKASAKTCSVGLPEPWSGSSIPQPLP